MMLLDRRALKSGREGGTSVADDGDLPPFVGQRLDVQAHTWASTDVAKDDDGGSPTQTWFRVGRMRARTVGGNVDADAEERDDRHKARTEREQH